MILLCFSLFIFVGERTNVESYPSAGYITDVRDILVGHYSKTERATGCTVILCNTSCTAGVDVRGAAPGTRETDLLDPVNTVEIVNAIVLSGGSAFGLEAASGVVKCLVEKNMGLLTRAGRLVPIVPAAVLYDLAVGNNSWIVPDTDSGYNACMHANNREKLEGNVGAGTGATIGKYFGIQQAMKGGLGSASWTVQDKRTNATVTVGVIVVVNPIGDIYKQGKLFAGARTADGKRLINSIEHFLGERRSVFEDQLIGQATTLACIATDAKLTKAQAKKVSQMAHDGLARAINPVHTTSDGDVVFTLATGASSITDTNLVGMIAAHIVEEAIIRAIEQSESLPGIPNLNDFIADRQFERLF